MDTAKIKAAHHQHLTIPAKKLNSGNEIKGNRAERFFHPLLLNHAIGRLARVMKLAHLAQQIVRVAPPDMLTDQMLYASLDFDGSHNRHLAIPDWHSREHRTWEMQRFEFLTGEEEIGGDILVFDYCSHDGRMLLRECASLNAAAKLVLGGAGVFNVFTDIVLVFDHFRFRPYRASYCDETGTRLIFDGRHTKDDKPLLFRDRQIEWLELAA